MSQLRIAVRTLGRHRGFATVAVLSLAVAIALNTTMYSVLQTLLGSRLGVRAEDEIRGTRMYGGRDHQRTAAEVADVARYGRRAGTVTPAMVDAALRELAPSVVDWTSYHTIHPQEHGVLPLAERGDHFMRVQAGAVRPNYFELLGVQPVAGRIFSRADEGHAVAVISDRLARRLFDRESPIAQAITVEGESFTVIGVVERYPGYWPLTGDVWGLRSGVRHFPTILRLRPGADTGAVRSELKRAATQLAHANGDDPAGWRFSLAPIKHDRQLGDFHKALIGAVLAVLLVACANLANLQLARGLARGRELALRAAIGASRRALVRHLLLESGVLAAAGLALGVVLTWWGITMIRAYIPPEIEGYLVEPKPSWGMFGFAALAAVVCLVLVGLLPALHISRVDPNAMLKSGAGTGANKAHRRRYGFLIVAQVGFALPVLIGAVVSLKGSWRLHDADYWAREHFGFDPNPIVLSGVRFAAGRPSRPTEWVGVAEELRTRALRVQGVAEAAAAFTVAPVKNMVTVGDDDGGIREMMAHQWSYRAVTPTYLKVYGRRIERGRDFVGGAADQRAVLMDAPTARFLWGSRDPIGREIKFGSADSDAPWHAVVGIIGDMRDTFAIRRTMRDANFRLYEVLRAVTPDDASPAGGQVSATLHARANRSTELTSIRLQRALRDLNPADPPTATPLVYWLGNWRVQQDFVASLFTTFALVGIALVGIGVYGIVTHSVEERRREIGVRIALGATSRDVVRSLIREGNVLLLTGIAAGLLFTKYSVWWLGSFVDDRVAYDAVLFAGISAGLFAGAVASALLPAWRATRTDPVEALRHE